MKVTIETTVAAPIDDARPEPLEVRPSLPQRDLVRPRVPAQLIHVLPVVLPEIHRADQVVPALGRLS